MPEVIESKTFDEIRPGDTASSDRSFASADLRAWSVLSGASDGQSAVGLATSLFSSLAEARLPGPGSVIRSISVEMHQPIKAGATRTTLIVKGKVPDRRTVVFDGQCTDASGGIIASAVLEVEPSSSKLRQATAEHCLDRLVDACRGLKPIPHRRRLPLKRRRAWWRHRRRERRTDHPCPVRAGKGNQGRRRQSEPRHIRVQDRGCGGPG